MKKIIIVLATTLLLGFSSNVMAQSDGFFSEWNENRDETPTDPIFPASHGAENNQQAPLGSGLLILAGLGIAYAIKKK